MTEVAPKSCFFKNIAWFFLHSAAAACIILPLIMSKIPGARQDQFPICMMVGGVAGLGLWVGFMFGWKNCEVFRDMEAEESSGAASRV